MPELHPLMVLFGTNLVTNISTKASKKHHISFLLQIRGRFNVHFSSYINLYILYNEIMPFLF